MPGSSPGMTIIVSDGTLLAATNALRTRGPAAGKAMVSFVRTGRIDRELSMRTLAVAALLTITAAGGAGAQTITVGMYGGSFEKAMRENHKAIAPSMIYAYAALKSGVGFANGAPNLTVDIPALIELAEQQNLPICGKDFKTGQTLMKTILAPGLKARLLGLHGWYSTNILGNRDGEVLDDPGSFKTKEESKLSVLEYILQPKVYPMGHLHGAQHHVTARARSSATSARPPAATPPSSPGPPVNGPWSLSASAPDVLGFGLNRQDTKGTKNNNANGVLSWVFKKMLRLSWCPW